MIELYIVIAMVSSATIYLLNLFMPPKPEKPDWYDMVSRDELDKLYDLIFELEDEIKQLKGKK